MRNMMKLIMMRVIRNMMTLMMMLTTWMTESEEEDADWSIWVWEMRSILFWTSTMGMEPHSSSTWGLDSQQ